MVSIRDLLRVIGWLAAAAAIVAFCLLIWGGDLLIADDSSPGHADAAVALQGSMVAQKVRIAGAMDLLRRGITDRVLLSVEKESYWGQSMPPIARDYLARNYGAELAARVDFCETNEDVDSTEQEARSLMVCIQGHHWRSFVIVTSNYHTRRARMLWRRVTRHEPDLHLWVHGVNDPEFLQPWWKHRESAKIWILECSKLAWTILTSLHS